MDKDLKMYLDEHGSKQRLKDYWPLGVAFIVCILILGLPQIMFGVLNFLIKRGIL